MTIVLRILTTFKLCELFLCTVRLVHYASLLLLRFFPESLLLSQPSAYISTSLLMSLTYKRLIFSLTLSAHSIGRRTFRLVRLAVPVIRELRKCCIWSHFSFCRSCLNRQFCLLQITLSLYHAILTQYDVIRLAVSCHPEFFHPVSFFSQHLF